MSLLLIPEKQIIDFQDTGSTQVTAAASANRFEVTSITTRGGKRPKLVALRNAVEAAGQTFITWHLEVNRAVLSPYDSFTSQIAPPESDNYLPVPIEIPQLSIVRLTVDNSSVTTGYLVTGRLIVYYESYF